MQVAVAVLAQMDLEFLAVMLFLAHPLHAELAGYTGVVLVGTMLHLMAMEQTDQDWLTPAVVAVAEKMTVVVVEVLVL
jgi:hypothetical protein